MWTINKIRCENFRLLHKVDFTIPKGLVLIHGMNEDIPGSDSNMGGKSTLLHALTWCLYGCDSTGAIITKSAIHTDADYCKVICTFLSEEGRQVTLTRVRRKKPSPGTPITSVQLSMDGKRKTGTPEEIQARIDALFGKQDLFLAAHIFGCGEKEVPFALRSDKQQKQLFDLLLSAEDLDAAFLCAKEALDKSRLRRDALQKTLSNTSAQRKLNAENRSQHNTLDNVHALNIEKELIRLTDHLKVIEAEHKKTKSILAATQDRYANLEKKERVLQKELNDIETHRNRHIIDLQKVKADMAIIQNMDQCPTCKTKVSPKTKANLLIPHTTLVKEIEKKLDMLPKTAYLKKKKEQVEDALRKAKAEEVEAKTKYDTASLDVNVITATIKQKKKELSNFQAHQNTRKRFNLHKGVLLFIKEMHIQEEIEHQTIKEMDLEFWLEGFGRSGIRAYRLDKITPILNELAVGHSDTLFGDGSRISYSTQRQLQSGEYRDRFSVEILNRRGEKEESPSSGQAMRRNLVHMFSIVQLASRLNKRTVRFLAFDEAFRTLDQTGTYRVMSILQRLLGEADSIFVIEHNSDLQARFDTVLTVTRKGNKSTISTK